MADLNMKEMIPAKQIELFTSSEVNTYIQQNLNRERSFEKEIVLLKNENKELKDYNNKLAVRLREMEKKIKIATMKIEEDYVKNVETILTEKDMKLKNLNEKIEELNRNLTTNNKKAEALESSLLVNINPDDIAGLINLNTLFKYFNDNVIKNIEKREEEKKKNKSLLEKIMILCKKIKKAKGEGK